MSSSGGAFDCTKTKLQPKTSWDSTIDDSSSLGYGSGSSSSTYDNWLQLSDRSDFYKDAEFYDLDSVKSFCVDGFCSNDECASCNREDDEFLLNSNCSKYEQALVYKKQPFVDIDDVEPTEQLRRFSQRVSAVGMDLLNSVKMLKLKVNDDCSRSLQRRPNINQTKRNEKTNNFETVSEDHIYEEIHYDTSVINLSGVQPPPLPSRNDIGLNKLKPLAKNINAYYYKQNSYRLRRMLRDEQKTHL